MDAFGEFLWTFFHKNSSFWVNFHGPVLVEFSRTFLVNFRGHFFNCNENN